MKNRLPECTVKGCHRPEYFTGEHLCRPHGLKRGVTVPEKESTPKADSAAVKE